MCTYARSVYDYVNQNPIINSSNLSNITIQVKDGPLIATRYYNIIGTPVTLLARTGHNIDMF